jgi:hypothetical protein
MNYTLDLDNFAAKVKEKILSGENPTDIRKYIRHERNLGKSQGNDFYNKIEKSLTKKERDTIPRVEVETVFVNAEGFQDHGDTAVAEIKGVSTLDGLIEAARVDLEVWEMVKSSVGVWKGDWSVKAEFRKRVEEKAIESLLEGFEKNAEKIAPKSFKYTKPKEGGKLYVLNLQDWHGGKIAKSSETGWGDYNLEIAKQVYKDAVDELIKSAPVGEIGTVMLVCGSDLIHFENEQVTTTKGTRLEGACSWHTLYNEVCEMITDVVQKLASQFKVEVMIVCGNHARLTEYALGSYVKAFFRNHENVNVDNRPLNRKYFGFEKTLICFTHTDGIKLADLPLIMMRENQKEVSNYEQFFVLGGHTHTEKLLDIKGIRVMICPALCPPDKYHVDAGYVGNVQAGQGLLFADWGLQQIIYSKGSEIKLI